MTQERTDTADILDPNHNTETGFAIVIGGSGR